MKCELENGRVSFMAVALIFLSTSATLHGDSNEISLPYYNSSDFTPRWIEDGAAENRIKNHRLGAFAFVNQRGEAIGDADMAGKIFVANFFYTLCGGLCSKITENLKSVQEAFPMEDDVQLISHTVIPEHDSVERLLQYSLENHIGGRSWNFVTGDKREIYALARDFYFADSEMGDDSGGNAFLHSENVVLVDGQGYIRGVYNGVVTTDMKRLIADIRTLKKERHEKADTTLSSASGSP